MEPDVFMVLSGFIEPTGITVLAGFVVSSVPGSFIVPDGFVTQVGFIKGFMALRDFMVLGSFILVDLIGGWACAFSSV